ncbi:apolipoprotein L6 isoform X1 [Camelus ferus]|uniref:Apolipoprotein L6 isoform X1 n=2 Tax=Camelus TaxID=9836 RepID=A0A8B8U0L2_CAMFR|nr:apolipoprotein L6 isoform X1 [Camelus ferus]XP_010944331.1 apolipoprotein L6-like isoform X1 [Camelus bactrianus]XP_032348002.1 apolipoprotein L6 isoform X1 [Camelus ferus]XP_032348003.1 apolipoprotein L6 isoform X1 [Camelus ferus]XP_032348004.1 apolipoprotein L6 isoform X1 [Camelus ferus]XP_045365728.1 apolipoprotein L6-like isoform X1 [Camelus bactrianus]XP_045365731.1 apolipoprotein L6-like isoform X1 [Camelus bactrianus]XP_045365734.1 apolipoprotein L6-like isoform X1 [Camelus bactria
MDLVLQSLPDSQAGSRADIPPCEDGEQDLSAEERMFLEEFPILKEELEVDIGKLCALADNADTTHRTSAKIRMVANSITVVSGAVSILGLALAPATAGGSLLLSAAGKALGTAGEVTNILNDALESFRNREAQGKVSGLMPTCGQDVRKTGTDYVTDAGKVVQICASAIKDIQKDIRAFQTARAHPRLAAAAKHLLTTGQVSAQKSRQVQRAFEGTMLVMKTNARLLGSVKAGFSLVMDLASLLKDWQRLKDGAKTELAEELRAQAWELERKLTELTQCYENLQQKKLLQEKKPMSSSSEGTMGTVPLPEARLEEAGCPVTGEDTKAVEPKGL